MIAEGPADDVMERGLEIISGRVRALREATLDVVTFLVNLEPMPPGALICAVKLYRASFGCDLGAARRAVIGLRAEQKRARLKVVAPAGPRPQGGE